MSLRADLGRFLLAHVDLPLRVEASAIATFHSSSLDTSELTSTLLERLLSLSAWACRRPGFCLVIRLLSDGQPWEMDRHEKELLRDLKNALRGAEVCAMDHKTSDVPLNHDPAVDTIGTRYDNLGR